ncbi:SPX [Macleaya cordata]|uniref:SPX n=1 Tax=Macleaya cordata TaxID=56857 RepID=A0A200QID5_MACCD|nr:SPX [Macleaya cordata]
MVKFSKQFEGQLIPEWKEAFVHKKLASSASKGDLYETELLEQFADTDAAKEFFARLDLQLNKVNQFYKTKEKEFIERGESLKKQMEILVNLKTSLKQQRGQNVSCQDSKEDASLSCTVSCEEDCLKETIDQAQLQDDSSCDLEKKEVQSSDSPKSDEIGISMKLKREDSKMRTLSGRDVVNCQGKNVRINIPLTTPTRTLSAISDLVWEDLVSPSKKCSPPGRSKLQVNKTKLHHAEKMIRGAFIELYKGLGYLKTYRNLNMLAFVKILKKFDKVTEKQALSIYLKVVESSYFNSSDKVVKLADEVEELFVKQFAEDDRRKAMKYLKPRHRKESHTVTFFIGLFTGCFIALFAGYVIMAHIAGMYTQQSDTVYMETVYPVLRHVVMLDFFMADQLCSQVPTLRSLEYVACYYITGSYRTQDYGFCMRTKHYRDLAYAVSFLPYYWRAMQCARRWFDEGQTSHLINLGKYVSAMLAAGAKVAYEKEKSIGWLALVVVMSSAATVYQLYWDFVKDWGLLQFDSKNPWLRNELMLRRKIIYYFSMGLNLVLRLAWLQTVLHSNFGSLDYRVMGLFLAALEVIRRGQWNFYRLENEHLNNAGKFRAVKSVPLPFHEVDDQD